jgi:integrase
LGKGVNMPRRAKLWRRAGRSGWWCTLGKHKVNLGDDKEAAQREYHRLKAAGRPVARSRLTVEALVHLYLADVVTRVKEVSFRSYKRFLEHWAEFAGNRIASELKPYDVKDFLAGQPTWNSSTRHIAVSRIRTWMLWCVDIGYLEGDPLKKVRRPKMLVRQPAPPGATEAFLSKYTKLEIQDIATVLYDTGARPGELRTLESSTIDWEASTAVVNGKTGAHTISLTARSLEILRRLAAANPSGPLFRNSRGNPWKAKALRKRFAGSGIVAYHFRHALWSRARKAGVDSIEVARQLGHKDLKMLMERYAHADSEQIREAIEAAAAIGNTPSTVSSPPQPAPEPEPEAPQARPGKTPRKKPNRSQ